MVDHCLASSAILVQTSHLSCAELNIGYVNSGSGSVLVQVLVLSSGSVEYTS